MLKIKKLSMFTLFFIDKFYNFDFALLNYSEKNIYHIRIKYSISNNGEMNETIF